MIYFSFTGGKVLLEVLQRAWFVLGFIVFVIAWSWQSGHGPDQGTVKKAFNSLIIAGAVVGVLLLITAISR